MGILHSIQGEEGFAFCIKFVAEAFTFPPWRRMSNEHYIGESSDKLIPNEGAGGGGALLFFLEGREQQQALLLKGHAPGGRESQVLNTSRWANKNWLCALEKDAQAFFFEWRMEATDDGDSGITEHVSQFVGLANDRFGTLDRAEERDQRTVLLLMQEVEVAARHHGSWGTISEIQPE
jgi:hypothetical protein